MSGLDYFPVVLFCNSSCWLFGLSFTRSLMLFPFSHPHFSPWRKVGYIQRGTNLHICIWVIREEVALKILLTLSIRFILILLHFLFLPFPFLLPSCCAGDCTQGPAFVGQVPHHWARPADCSVCFIQSSAFGSFSFYFILTILVTFHFQVRRLVLDHILFQKNSAVYMAKQKTDVGLK